MKLKILKAVLLIISVLLAGSLFAQRPVGASEFKAKTKDGNTNPQLTLTDITSGEDTQTHEFRTNANDLDPSLTIGTTSAYDHTLYLSNSGAGDFNLNIAGTLEVNTLSGTATQLGGYTSGGIATSVTIGSGLSLSSGTLTATASGANISGTPSAEQLALWINATTVKGSSEVSYLESSNTFRIFASNAKVSTVGSSGNTIIGTDGTGMATNDAFTIYDIGSTSSGVTYAQGTDTGALPYLIIGAQADAATEVATRPLIHFNNHTTQVAELDHTGDWDFIDNNLATTGAINGNYVKSDVLTDTQIKASNSTPIELIPAVSSGQIVVIHKIYLSMSYNSSAYTTNTNLIIEYSDGTNIVSGPLTGFLSGTINKAILINGAAYSTGSISVEPGDGLGIQLTTSSGDPVAGDSDVRYKIWYSIEDI